MPALSADNSSSLEKSNDSRKEYSDKESKEGKEGKVDEKSEKADDKDIKSPEKEKSINDVKMETSSDELDSMPDDDQATNEQTHPSSKHIENEAEEKRNEEKDKSKGRPKKHLERAEEASESGSGSGLSISNNDALVAIVEEEESSNAPSRDFLAESMESKLADVFGGFDNIRLFNKNVPSSTEAADEVQDEDNGSADLVDESSGISGDESSGVKKSNKNDDNEGETKNAENEKVENKNSGVQAAEKERTENAEKYEDEEKQEDKDTKKPVQQKKKNLMESMLESGDARAVSVTKGKTREKVPIHSNKDPESETESESADEEEEDATNVNLDFKDTGLEQFSGSGGENGTCCAQIHLLI